MLLQFNLGCVIVIHTQMIRELLQQTLSMLNINTVEEKKQLEDHPLSSHYKFGKFSDILKRSACYPFTIVFRAPSHRLALLCIGGKKAAL